MLVWLLSISFFLFALVLLLGALRLLGKLQWLKSWAQGMAFLVFLAGAAAVGVFGIDLLSYRETSDNQWVANLSFEQTGAQSFEAILVNTEGEEARYHLLGDQWQLDAHILSFKGISSRALYRLDRLSGRYLTLEQERSQPKSSYRIGSETQFVDAWATVRRYNVVFPLLEAFYGTASYLPMVDGAAFSISLGPQGLIGRPLNRAATAALSSWYSSS